MIFARIRKWIPIGGIEHTATSWTVYLDKELTHKLEEHLDSNMLEVFISAIEIPKGETYYVKPVMKFNKEEVTYDIDAIPVVNLKQEISNMMLKEEPYIETPYMFLTKEDIFSGQPEITLRSSKFRSNIDIWHSTSYFIFSPDDKILHYALDQIEFKEALVIPNLDLFKNYASLKLGIVHKGLSGVESKFNITTLVLTQELDYTIITNLINVPVGQDLDVEIKPLKEGDNLRILRVELCDKSSSKPIIKLNESKKNIFTVPKDYLKSGYKYKIGITKALTNSLDNTTYYHELEVASGIFDLIKSENFVYKGFIDTYNEIDMVKLPDNTITESMYDGTIYVPNGKTKLLDAYHTEYREDKLPKLVTSKATANGINLLNENVEGTIIRMLEKNVMLIDTLNEKNKPTFLIYTFVIADQAFTLTHSKTREDETKGLGHTGSIVQISREEIIYNPVNTNWLRKYNYVTNTIVDLPHVPYEVLNYGMVIRNKNNRVYIGNTEDFNACVFNYNNLEFTEGYLFGPNNFVNKQNMLIPLINGNTLMVNKELMSIKDTSGIVEYNLKRGVFENKEVNFEESRPTAAALCLYGEVILTGHEPEMATLATDYSKYLTWIYR